MDRPQEQLRKQDVNRGTAIVLSSDSDGDGDLSRASVRDKTARKRQHRFDSGSQPKSSTKNRPTGSKSLNGTTRTDSKDTQTSSQDSSVRSQPPAKSTPSQKNSTLAERVAGHGPDTHERFTSRRVVPSILSCNSKSSSQHASQVQISRGLSRASSFVLGETNPSNVSPDPSGKASILKRSLERDGEVEESLAVKRLKVDQVRGQSPKQPPNARRPNTLSTPHHFSGSGIGSNPIVISDSPPPESHHERLGGSLLLGRQQGSKQTKNLASKAAGRATEVSVPISRATSLTNEGDSRRETAENNSDQMMKSPTIPESLPGSPERNGASAVTDFQSPLLPLFIQASKEISDDPLGTKTETISSFAEQAEALLASQPDGTPTATAATRPEQPGDNRAMPQFSSSRMNLDCRAASLSGSKDASSSTIKQPANTAEVMNLNLTKPLAPPAVRTIGRNLPNAIPQKLTPANYIEQVISKYDQELRGDNAYWTRTWLKQARHATTENKWNSHAPTSVFRNMQLIQQVPTSEDKRTSDLFARFTVETFNGSGKTSRRPFAVSCTMYHTPTEADVPNYSHFVNIKYSFLARNETVLQHWPYFHDDFDIRGAFELDEHYYLDVKERERKIKRLASAENYAEYVEDMLRDVDCNWSDILRFLLDLRPNVGTNPDALAALQKRDKYCDEDFVRGGQRWTTVLSKLPASNDPDRIGRAALLCEYFKKIAKFQLWHVARRSAYVTRLLEESDPRLDLNELTCRVCMRFSCPYHGEMHENDWGGSDSERDGSVADDVVETDIIHPQRVNYRSRVTFPSEMDADEAGGQVDPRRKRLEYWHKLNLNHYPDDRRGPFYPCYHPGTTCEKTRCSCYENRIPCEKSCACDSSCKRKWQGCECRMKGGKICFEDARCVCFQNGRECDADLCGDCGVSDVLDPVHRHDETILTGRCSNASIQRGVPKHTILGDSGIHGLGLYACEDIKHHDFVGEYKGEIITKDEAERRGAVYEHQKLSYLFSLNNRQEVDSTLFGNKVRFINHAPERQANLYPRIIMVNTVFRIALYGARAIDAGQELLFDYGPQFPQDQLGVSGNKASKGGKAAPHVRNKNLVAQFDDIVESFDKFGNRRARKAAAGDKRGRFAPKVAGVLPRGGNAVGERTLVTQKSIEFPLSIHRGGRPRLDRPADPEDVETAQNPFDDMDLDAGQRLSSYNVAYEDEDDDLALHSGRSNVDQEFVDSSSIDSDDEDEDDGKDGEEEAIPTLQRSSRRRM